MILMAINRQNSSHWIQIDFLSTARWARVNFHEHLAVFKANGRLTDTCKKKEMSTKTVDSTTPREKCPAIPRCDRSSAQQRIHIKEG
jgi:hypothetical protein